MTHKPFFPTLNGLRFLLALWVLFYHIALITMGVTSANDRATALVLHGYLAVDVFFVLSGFVVTHAYGDQLTFGNKADYARFLQRRLARLYPLHLLTLGMLLLLVLGAKVTHRAVSAENYSLASLLANLLLVQSWRIPATLNWNHPAWAISIEWLLYLLTPLLLAVFYRPSRTRVMVHVCVLCGAALAFFIAMPFTTHSAYAVSRGLLGFCLGMAVCRLRAGHSIASPPVTRFLCHPVLQLFGHASFALYIVQYPVLLVLRHVWPYAQAAHPALHLLGVGACVMVFAVAAHLTVERPLYRLLLRDQTLKRNSMMSPS